MKCQLSTVSLTMFLPVAPALLPKISHHPQFYAPPQSLSMLLVVRVMQKLVLMFCYLMLFLPLYLIFKSSINGAKIPKQWKFARVSAIFKKGNRKLACNYRPVSITSIICRILETIIRNSIVKFLVSNDLLSVYQYGFLKGRSTTLQLMKVLNDWTESMENKFSTDCIYLDYQKAFDSVPHRRLISKLRSYKII